MYRYYPFTIIVKDRDVRNMENLPSYRIKIDPGSKTTGIAVVEENTDKTILFAQLEHRGQTVKSNLDTRHDSRRNRRSRETVYRKCKFPKGSAGTAHPEGWLPPSVKSTGDSVLSVTKKLSKLMNIRSCSFEAVRFDTQLMENPEISGKEYQHGTLFGCEIREYLLEKFGHTCQYCGGVSKDDVLEWEHKVPKSRGGSDSVKNATLSCRCCNQEKGNRKLREWHDAISGKKHKSALDEARLTGIKRVMEGKDTAGNRYAAWVTSLRRHIEKDLFGMFGDVECSSGGRTKYNRTELGLPKDHHYDALCVGNVPEAGYRDCTNGYVLYIKAMGRGTRFRGKINACGIIVQKLAPRAKRVFGFMNGDIVAADPVKGKYAGHHVGRVMTRATGFFDIRTTNGTLVTVKHDTCRLLQYTDGYQYKIVRPIPLGN